MLEQFFELLTIGADFSQFVSLSKNIADEKLFEQLLANQRVILKLLLEIRGDNKMKIVRSYNNLFDAPHGMPDNESWMSRSTGGAIPVINITDSE